MHRLLLRQLKKTTGIKDAESLTSVLDQFSSLNEKSTLSAEETRILQALPDLLERISLSYEQFDRDYALATRSMQLSSYELFEANRQMQQKSEEQSRAMASLFETARDFLGNEQGFNENRAFENINQLSKLIAQLASHNKDILQDLNNQKFAMDQHAIVSITDRNGRIIYVNDKFCESCGYSASELIGQSHNIVKSGEHPPEFFQNLWQTIKSGKVWHGEVCNRHKSGSFYWVSATIVPLQNAEGEIEKFIAIRTEITERIEAEQVANRAKREADFANKAKSEFLSNMSHELRTPLNALLGFAQLLQMSLQKLEDGRIKDRTLNQVATMLSSGDHLLSLIDEVLDLAKIESGKLSLSVESVYIEGVMEELMYIAHTLPKKYNPDVTLTLIQENLDQYLMIDSTRFRQVLLNLITNAIKYNRPHGEVFIRVNPPDNGYCRFEIEDTGYGISEDKQKLLFTPFERLGAERSTIEGTGIGLTLCQRLVEALDGQMGFTSTEGQGSCFWFEFPTIHCPVEEKENRDLQKSSLANYQGKKVLYIEDNFLNIQLFEGFFEGYPEVAFVSALDGSSGIKICKNFEPDIVFLDMNLPDIHGFNVFRAIKDDPKLENIPIIALSADISNELIEQAQDLGFITYLPKPVSFDKLIRTMNATFGEAE